MSESTKSTSNEAKNGNKSKPLLTAVFLIEKIWLDSLENEIGSAKGYLPFGYVNSEKEAVEFCNSGRIYTSKDCWAVSGEEKQFRYRKLQYCG
jgi:hypothetical protein